MFVTRDELLGYQLPSKLSHLTKLHNQLLALPLAINLDKLQLEGKTSKGNSFNQQKQKDQPKGSCSSVSDIKQVIIKCGQVLKICGVYEDVLPLIEGGSKQSMGEFKHASDIATHPYDGQISIQHYQMAPQSGVLYQQMAAHQQRQQLFKANNSYNQMNQHLQHQPHESAKFHKLLKLRYTNEPQQRVHVSGRRVMQPANGIAGGDHYALAPPLIYGPQQAPPPTSSPPNRLSVTSRQVGQRYARCVLLNQRSIDKLCANQSFSGSAGSDSGESGSDEEETEVLIPIDQKGRFYLCATNQSVINELYCRGCNASNDSSNLVFRLSQIVSLLSLSKRLFLCDNKEASRWQQRRTGPTRGCQVDPVSLPLTVRLITGPRPMNFSPAMFGSSSTMESYFRLESNVGGHSIRCKYNKSAVSVDQQVSAGDVNGCSPINTATSPVCSCPQGVPASENEAGYGLFSAMLRIERISKRDVLLACTIKPDPLLHLDLVTGSLAARNQLTRKKEPSQTEAGQQPSKQALWITAGRTTRIRSDRLMALRETGDEGDHLKSFGKSSFSRLRACRSLISLNGRRNKKRPNIPNSMLPASGQYSSNVAPPVGATGNPGKQDSTVNTGGGSVSSNAQSVLGLIGADAASQSDSSIVMVEFDCRDTELKFVRTFVESSIPTSSIPDLVLSRMDFCHKNSLDWERQLKLSYRTLGRDFDSCQRQMELTRLEASRLAEATAAELARASQNEASMRCGQSQQQRLALVLAASKGGPCSLSASDSTSSSRSSSGVSSAGRENRKRASPSSGSQATSSPSGGPAGKGAALASTSVSSGSASSTSHSSSRLLRLVQRILPGKATASGQLEYATEGGSASETETNERERRQKVMEELSCRFRSELVVDCGSDKSAARTTTTRPAPRTEPIVSDQDNATLMNAQKIHRKLLKTKSETNGLAHCSLDECGSQMDCRENRLEPAENTAQNTRRRMAEPAEQNAKREEEDDDSSSHLYESLERLNECLKRGKLRLEGSSVGSPALGGGAPRPPITIPGKLGRSMELLASRRTRERNNNATRRSDDDDNDDDDDDDEWWRSSTRESTSERQRLCGDQQASRRRRQVAEKPQSGQRSAGKSADRCRAIGSKALVRPASSGFVVGAWRAGGNSNDEDDYGRDRDGAMEPVSIEACHDEFVSMVEMDEAEPELIYQNLAPAAGQGIQRHQSSFELDKRRHLVGRMERKLMKLRNRNPAGSQAGHSEGWLSERELFGGSQGAPSGFEEPPAAEGDEELELRSINLPASAGELWRRRSLATTSALSEGCRLPRPTYLAGGGRRHSHSGRRREPPGSCSSESVHSFGSAGGRQRTREAGRSPDPALRDGAPDGQVDTAGGPFCGANSLRSSSFGSSSSCLSSSGSGLEAAGGARVGVRPATSSGATVEPRQRDAAWSALAAELGAKQIPFKAKLAAVGQVTGQQQQQQVSGRIATLDRACYGSG